MTRASSGSPPLPTNAQKQKAGRNRLPPARTSSRSSSSGSASAPSTRDQRVISAPSSVRIRDSTRSATVSSAVGNVASRRSMLRRLARPGRYSPRVPEFLSDAWLTALDDAARAAGPLPALAGIGDGDGDAPFVLQQVVRDGDDAEVRYRVEFAASGLRVRADDERAADVTFATDRATAAALSRGETNAQRARAPGHFQVSGDIEGLVARSDALVALDDVFAAVRAETTYR